MTDKLYGYYETASQLTPTYDPPHDAPCLCCGEPITPDDVRTISIAYVEDRRRSFFYRAHRTCHEALSRADQDKLDGVIFEQIARDEMQ